MTCRFRPQKRLLHASGFGALLLFAGCASMPPEPDRADFQEPPPMEQSLAKAGPQAEATPDSAWPQAQWWREFRSPDLDQVMETALKDNPGLKEAYARLGAASGVAEVQGATLLPWLDADNTLRTVRYAKHGVVSTYNPALGGTYHNSDTLNLASFRYEIDFWGKYRALFDAALGEEAAQRAEFANAELLLTTAIARAYIRGVSLAQQLAVAQNIVEVRRRLLEVQQTRFKTGLATDDDVRAAEIGLEDAVKKVDGTRALLVLHQDLLAQLMGTGPDATQNLFAGKNVAIPAKISLPPHLPIELLGRRPDLAAAMHRAEAAAERIHVAKAQFLPSVDLAAATGGLEAAVATKNFGSLASLLFRASDLNFAFDPAVRLPIFEGGLLRGQLSVARASYDEAVELYNSTLLHAVQEVADGLTNWKESGSIVSSQHRLLGSARGELNLTQVRLRSGLNDRREVLASQSALLDQVYILNGLQADHLFAMVDLIQALGGGNSNGIEVSRPHLAPEEALSGLVEKTPAWALDSLASPLLGIVSGMNK